MGCARLCARDIGHPAGNHALWHWRVQRGHSLVRHERWFNKGEARYEQYGCRQKHLSRETEGALESGVTRGRGPCGHAGCS